MQEKKERLFSLDLLRGLDMFYLAVVSGVLVELFRVLELDPAWERFFCTHPWSGFTLYDFIMPLFMFMCGAAIPFSLGRRLEGGKPGPSYWRHVASRVALLWGLGLLAQGRLATLDIRCISFYCNALQTIAVGYLVAAFVFTIRSWKVRVLVPIALTILYGFLLHFGGDYMKDGNLAQIVELKILHALLPADSEQTAFIVKYGCTWHLPSLMFPVITLAGCFATEILRRQDWSDWKRAIVLGAYGIGSLAVGWLLVGAGVPMIKNIWTVSFSLQAIGWSVLSLAVLFVLTDIWKFRRGVGLFLLFGQFSLAAYMCETVFRETCFAAGDRLFSGVWQFFNPKWTETVRSVGFGLVVIAVLFIRRRLKARS